jgi:hypothetical protein
MLRGAEAVEMTGHTTWSARLLARGALLGLVLTCLACGDDDGGGDDDDSVGGDASGSDGSAPDAAAGETFACGTSGEACVIGAEYCVVELVDDVETMTGCAALPDGCTDCECARTAWPAGFPDVAACGGCEVTAPAIAPELVEITIRCSE